MNRETQVFGLAVTGGVISTTGIAGLTLGGGLGWIMARDGLALDNLLSADVLTADGRVLHASADDNADLFWALRAEATISGSLLPSSAVSVPSVLRSSVASSRTPSRRPPMSCGSTAN